LYSTLLHKVYFHIRRTNQYLTTYIKGYTMFNSQNKNQSSDPKKSSVNTEPKKDAPKVTEPKKDEVKVEPAKTEAAKK
jgi:hypothetical protein